MTSQSHRSHTQGNPFYFGIGEIVQEILTLYIILVTKIDWRIANYPYKLLEPFHIKQAFPSAFLEEKRKRKKKRR